MGLTFLLDEDISYKVAERLRRRGVDATSVHELRRAGRGVPDEDQLTFATEHRRVLVTYNRADFQALDLRWRNARRVHSGILWCHSKSFPARAIGELVRALETVANQNASFDGLCVPLQRPLQR